MTHSAKAAPIPEIPKLLSLSTTTPVTQPPIDLMKEWLFHTDIVSKVVPLEVLILLCLIFLFLFKFARMIYRRLRRTTARTSVMLEVGNDKNSVILPILDLKHPPNSHRFVMDKADVQLRMIERNLLDEIWWSKDVTFMNSALAFQLFFLKNCVWIFGRPNCWSQFWTGPTLQWYRSWMEPVNFVSLWSCAHIHLTSNFSNCIQLCQAWCEVMANRSAQLIRFTARIGMTLSSVVRWASDTPV